MAPLNPAAPSLDRPAVSRPAAALAGPLAAAGELSSYRLAGGTALAWAIGHRRSDDLDFFTRLRGRLDAAEQERISQTLRSLDEDAEIDLSQSATVHALVRGCKVSFFEVGGRWITEPTWVAEGLAVASVEEIAAMKLIAVATRSARKDFFDLHALTNHDYTADRMFSALARMHPGEIDLDAGLHIARALTDFGDAELDPDPIILDSATWMDAKRSAAGLAADLHAHLLDQHRLGLIR